MAEEKEIKYIPYGTDEIDYNLFITNAANEVLNYVNSQSWSNKRKESFLNAYLNLISQGITGASNDTGVWRINHNGDIPLETLSKRDREMYGEAAYFLRKQMSRITPHKKEEEKKKEDLEKFNFTSQFLPQIWNNRYGGNDKLFASEWENLDERGENGLRGTDNRKIALKEELTKYKENLINNKGKYNFEGTAFKDEDDVIRRIDEAIAAIDSPDLKDDNPKLNALGLSYNLWFSNGGNDIYGTTDDGKLVTYQLYYENQLKEALEKAKAKAEALKAIRANYWDGYKSINLSKYQPRQLTALESTIEHLQQLFAKDKWSGDEASQIVSAFKLAEQNNMLVPLSKEELARLNPTTWKNRSQYLRKIKDVGGLYYDTLSKQYKKFYKNGQTPQASFLDVLNLNNSEAIAKKKVDSDLKLREQYAKRTEMTPQDWEYVASVVPDIASIPDTEPISAAALAFTGAGMRHHALANRPGGMSSSDKWWLTADYLGAGLAAIPGFGDAYLVGRILNTTRKFATGLFAAAGAYGLGSATVNAFKKWAKGEDMTLQEKMDVVMAIPSLVSAYRLRSREGLNDAAKAANLNNITTNKGKVKVTITDESGNKSVKEITGLSEQKSKELLKQFRNAGNDNSKKTQILKNDSEVLTKASEQGIDLNKVSIETDSRYMASYRKPTEIEFYSETSPSSARARYNQEIENLKNSGHNWQARRLLIYDKFYRGTGGAKKESDGNWFKKAWHYIADTPNLEFANRIKNGEAPKTNSTEVPKTTETKSTETPKINKQKMNKLKEKFGRSKTESSNPKLEYNLKQQHKSEREIELFEKSYGTKNSSSKNQFGEGYGSNNNTIKNGELNVDLGNGIKFNFKVNNAAEYKGNPGKVSTLRGLVAKKIKEQLYNGNVDRVKVGELIRNAKRYGWLKQGGTIENLDTEIKEILKTL